MRGNRELTCLPLVEIVPAGGFYDYEAKYTPGATEEIVPARIPEVLASQARELAARCHRAFGCRGMSRVDMIVSPDAVWVLEVNTIPGMTPTSLLPRAAAEAGIPFTDPGVRSDGEAEASRRGDAGAASPEVLCQLVQDAFERDGVLFADQLAQVS